MRASINTCATTRVQFHDINSADPRAPHSNCKTASPSPKKDLGTGLLFNGESSAYIRTAMKGRHEARMRIKNRAVRTTRSPCSCPPLTSGVRICCSRNLHSTPVLMLVYAGEAHLYMSRSSFRVRHQENSYIATTLLHSHTPCKL